MSDVFEDLWKINPGDTASVELTDAEGNTSVLTGKMHRGQVGTLKIGGFTIFDSFGNPIRDITAVLSHEPAAKPYAEGASTAEPRLGDVVRNADENDNDELLVYLPRQDNDRSPWMLISPDRSTLRFSRRLLPKALQFVAGWNLEPDTGTHDD